MNDAQRKGIALAGSILAAATLTVSTTMTAEGWKNVPYKDSGGVWTVCNGETHNIDIHRTYSDLECIQMFVVSLVRHGTEVAPCLPQDGSLPDKTRAALTDFAYNIGTGAFCKSTASAKAMAKDYAGSCRAISLFNKAGGKDCNLAASNCYGVIIRRKQERKDCLNGLGITEN